MDLERVKIIQKEFGEHLHARIKLGPTNLLDIIEIAKYCLVANLLILEKRHGTYMNLKEQFIEEFSYVITNLIKERYSDELDYLLELFKIETEILLENESVKNLVNQHYNELYGSEGGDVI